MFYLVIDNGIKTPFVVWLQTFNPRIIRLKFSLARQTGTTIAPLTVAVSMVFHKPGQHLVVHSSVGIALAGSDDDRDRMVSCYLCIGGRYAQQHH